MTKIPTHFAKTWPPLAALLIAGIFLVLVPLHLWAMIGVREWGYGGSPAAHLEAPYFWAVLLLRTVGSVAMAVLLLAVRKAATLWVIITASWLIGPPLSFLLTGIFLLADSGAQNSLPHHWSFLAWSCLLPSLVTAGLLGSRRVRQYYGVQAAQ